MNDQSSIHRHMISKYQTELQYLKNKEESGKRTYDDFFVNIPTDEYKKLIELAVECLRSKLDQQQ